LVRHLLLTPEAVKRLLNYLILGTRGGYARARIIETIRSQQLNAHQLSERLGYDYSTIRHHLEVLIENNLITASGNRYGQIYSISPELESNYETFVLIYGTSFAAEKKTSHPF
jgi:DNA-binding transcriptional ArsR family regulator